MLNNYFDNRHPLRPYTHSLPATPGTRPPINALRGDAPPTAPEGFHPAQSGGAWTMIEDHRHEEGYVKGEPYTIKDFGPYPEGWSATPPPPTPEEEQAALQARFTAAIQGHLDSFAQTRNYDSIMSAATYAASVNPKFQAEGQYAVEARDAAWARGYEILDAVLTGQRPMPTIEEVIAELPPLAWPDEEMSA